MARRNERINSFFETVSSVTRSVTPRRNRRPPPAEEPLASVEEEVEALFAAVQDDNAAQLEQALSDGAAVDSTMTMPAEKYFSAGKITPLMLAVSMV